MQILDFSSKASGFSDASRTLPSTRGRLDGGLRGNSCVVALKAACG